MMNEMNVMWMLLFAVAPVAAQENGFVGGPDVSISINVAAYPQLVRVPGYPVYYAPRLSSNYFFYDGMYWIFEDDTWFASSWYNGPWRRVSMDFVPVYLLRVPVRYYRHAPAYFRGWQLNAPPRWGEHWGNEWAQRHGGWDRWQRGAAPAPAPLPVYQRKYSGDSYPAATQQPTLQDRNYSYQPRDAAVRQQQQEPPQHAPATRTIPAEIQPAPPIQPLPLPPESRPTTKQSAPRHPEPIQPGPQPVPIRSFAANQPQQQQSATAPHPTAPAPAPQKGHEGVDRAVPNQPAPQAKTVPLPQPRQQARTEAVQHLPPAPKPQKLEAPAPVKAAAPAPEHGQQQEQSRGQERHQEKSDEHGPERQK